MESDHVEKGNLQAIGAFLLDEIFKDLESDGYSTNGLPEIDETLHTPELVAELQKPALELWERQKVGDYACEQPAIFDRLTDAGWFNAFVRYQYAEIVFAMESVGPMFSDYWIRHAHFRWMKDMKYVSGKEYDGGNLDHFKRAGFLCYWLRRCPPLSDIGRNPDTHFASIRHRKDKPILIQYGNAFAAFDISFRLCRYFESSRKDRNYSPETRRAIATFAISQKSSFITDICYTLSEKNISPHSLNMLYKGLFVGFPEQ
jgi:hypothetical protein